jgi:hypothetical protein
MPAFRTANMGGGLAALAAGLWCSAAVSASATTFAFDQSGSTVPGFTVNASISIDGTLADLPTISNVGNPGPYNFSPLSAFDFTTPSSLEGHYTLADFTMPIYVMAYPRWSISATGISYFNITDTSDFIISGFGAASTIEFESDGATIPADCHFTGRCIASGSWDPVVAPEPASAVLLLSGLLGGALPLRKRIRSDRPAEGAK